MLPRFSGLPFGKGSEGFLDTGGFKVVGLEIRAATCVGDVPLAVPDVEALRDRSRAGPARLRSDP